MSAVKMSGRTRFHLPLEEVRWPLVVFFLGLLLTAVAVNYVNQNIAHDNEQRLNRLIERVQNTIQERIDDYVRALNGMRGLLSASPGISAQHFGEYLQQVEINTYPGAMGFAFVRYVPQTKQDQYVKEIRRSRGGDFKIKRLGEASSAFVIEMIEPMARNWPALGVDIGSEKVRRKGAELAVLRDAPTLSRRITLVQDEKKVAGFLLLLPVYRNDMPEGSPVEERWNHLIGWVDAAIRVDELLADVADKTDNLVDFELFEGDPSLRKNLLFDADGHLGKSGELISEAQYANRRTHKLVSFEVAGQWWWLHVSGNRSFEDNGRRQLPLFVMLVGFLLSLLISALLASSSKTARDARRLAERMTANLRVSEAEAREMLNELEQQQRALDEHAIVAMTDPQGTIHYVNDKFCEISGYTREELVGNNHRLIASGLHDKSFFREMYRCIAQGQVWKGDICNRTKEGKLYWVDTTIVPFRNMAGKPIRYVAIRTDVTANKAHEAALSEQRDRLQEMVREQTADLLVARDLAEASSRAKSEFISNMSHELRTPMHGIMALAEMGVRRAGDLSKDKQLQYFSGIQGSARRLMHLVNDVLDLAKLDAEKTTFNFQSLALLPLVEGVLRDMSGMAAQKEITLQLEASDMVWQVDADALRIEQVLSNLLVNAIKFSPASATIRLAFSPGEIVQPDGTRAAVSVQVIDQGVGIPETELEQIFDNFFQSSKTKTGAGGTGLGLAICRRIVEAHGGRIVARNNPDGGATFAFTLPLAD